MYGLLLENLASFIKAQWAEGNWVLVRLHVMFIVGKQIFFISLFPFGWLRHFHFVIPSLFPENSLYAIRKLPIPWCVLFSCYLI